MSSTFQQQHAKVVRVEVSVGSDDADRTISEFTEAIKVALSGGTVHAHNVSVQGEHYIIDGKVCLPDDYDPEVQNRKPGTFPPVWAGGPSEAERKQPGRTVEEDKPREFVRVSPTKSNVRNPATGRRIRSDKGKPRGARKDPVQKAS